MNNNRSGRKKIDECNTVDRQDENGKPIAGTYPWGHEYTFTALEWAGIRILAGSAMWLCGIIGFVMGLLIGKHKR
jgi:hypothetical protein